MAPWWLPEPKFFVPAVLEDRRWRSAVLAAASSDRAVLHVTHDDCTDGLGSDVLVRLAHGRENVATAFVEPQDIGRALTLIAQVPGRGRSLLVSDISLPAGGAVEVTGTVEALTRAGWVVEWRDHHHKHWAPEVVALVRPHLRVLSVDYEKKESGASLVQRDLLPGDKAAEDLASVVRDRDLWWNRDPRSQMLEDARRELGGPALARLLIETGNVDDLHIRTAAARYAERREREVAAAMRHARVHATPHGRIGVLYGRWPKNEAMHEMGRRFGTDVQVNVRPEGAFSLRSRPGMDICHNVCSRFGGGGHANASGGDLPVAHATLPLFWLRRGASRELSSLLETIGEEMAKAR